MLALLTVKPTFKFVSPDAVTVIEGGGEVVIPTLRCTAPALQFVLAADRAKT